MRLFHSIDQLEWGKLNLPLLGITEDWFGEALVPPLAFSLAADSKQLWFVATRQALALTNPAASSGEFTHGLWEHDVAELFIADPEGRSYLEFNLSPTGAWWAAKFSSPRELCKVQPDFQSQIRTYHDDGDPGCWIAAISIPIRFLVAHIGFAVGSPANAAFILNSPHQTFHSATKLLGETPDFHQPANFPRIIPLKLPVN